MIEETRVPPNTRELLPNFSVVTMQQRVFDMSELESERSRGVDGTRRRWALHCHDPIATLGTTEGTLSSTGWEMAGCSGKLAANGRMNQRTIYTDLPSTVNDKVLISCEYH